MKKWLIGTILIIMLPACLFSSNIKPGFRFVSDFKYEPFFYEPQYSMYCTSFQGSLVFGVTIDKFTIGFDLYNNYYSFSGQSITDKQQGAFNIVSGILSLYYNPLDWLELKFGIGGAWLSSKFNYNDLGFINYHQGGLSLLLNATFRPPWKYIEFSIINKIHLFFPTQSNLQQYAYNQNVTPYYQGSVRVEFHPYLDWIGLYFEAGGMPWVYASEPINITTGMFTWGTGITFDLSFPKTSLYMNDLKMKYAENRKISVIQQKTTDNGIDQMRKAEKGDVIVFSNIIFFSDSDQIKDESFPVLDQISEVLNEKPQLIIEIRGYTNAVGDPTAEMELSMSRAMMVLRYLSENGVDPYRMKASGYGGMLSKDKSVDESNRKVEIKILEISKNTSEKDKP